MIISDLRMAKISFCDRHVIKMSLSYLTTQGNRMPFIHKGSRLSPESYALSHQPHICQRSQQMQNILKIFETFCKLTRAPGRAKNNCQLTKANAFRSRKWTYWYFCFCFHVQIFLEIVNFGLHVTFTCLQKSVVAQNVPNLRLCERPLMRKDPLWLVLPHSTKPPRNQLHPESQTSCK